MELTDRELKDLATFFAKRFASFKERSELAEETGIAGKVQLSGSPEEAWLDIIKVANQHNKFNSLCEACIRRRPNDSNLSDISNLLAKRRSKLPFLIAATIVIVLVIVFIPSKKTNVPEEIPQNIISEPVFSDDKILTESTSKPNLVFQQPQDPNPDVIESASKVDPEPKSHPAKTNAILPGSKDSYKACSSETGQNLLGYWYAGKAYPGKIGDIITINGGANVRIDYPDKHNHYNARTTVVCVLSDGEKVKLDLDPVKVPGDAYWIPLTSNGIIR